MKGKHMTIIAIVVIVLMVAGIGLYPVKRAIREADINNTVGYVVCERVRVTGFDWEVDKSHDGYSGYIFIDGEYPVDGQLQYGVLAGRNRFVMFGEYSGEREFYGGMYPVFKSTRWEILYPVKRDGILPSFICPKYGLSVMDFKH